MWFESHDFIIDNLTEKKDSDDGISMKLSMEEHEDDTGKRSESFSIEIAQDESTLSQWI